MPLKNYPYCTVISNNSSLYSKKLKNNIKSDKKKCYTRTNSSSSTYRKNNYYTNLSLTYPRNLSSIHLSSQQPKGPSILKAHQVIPLFILILSWTQPLTALTPASTKEPTLANTAITTWTMIKRSLWCLNSIPLSPKSTPLFKMITLPPGIKEFPSFSHSSLGIFIILSSNELSRSFSLWNNTLKAPSITWLKNFL